MGSDEFYPEERPAHQVTVDGFWMDRDLITVADFGDFVDATGYRTTAESAPDPSEFPDAAPELLVPGSLMFDPPSHPVPLDNAMRWWSWKPGASWRSPGGPGTSAEPAHPVVHVSFRDATAYAVWAGKSLPDEKEWELAAHGGVGETIYAWGDEFRPDGVAQANTWEGRFPYENTKPGRTLTSAVRSFAANDLGIFDLIGNVWEWTTATFTGSHAQPAAASSCCAPRARRTTDLPDADRNDLRVIKGGSHLCSPDYCRRYRPAARQGQSVDTSTSHLGFRCIVRRADQSVH